MPGFFKLSSSKICSALLFSGYALMILVALMLPLVVLAKAAISVLLVFSLFYYLRRDGWLSLPSSIVALRIEAHEITLLTRIGSELKGQISGNSVVTPFLITLNVLPAAKKGMRYVVIFPDSMDRERFRELRVRLKWGI